MPRGGRAIYPLRIEVRYNAEQRERWEKCADGNISRWMRELCDREALKHYPVQADLSETDAYKARQVFKKRGCPRWMYHVIGVYCPGCDTKIPG